MCPEVNDDVGLGPGIDAEGGKPQLSGRGRSTSDYASSQRVCAPSKSTWKECACPEANNDTVLTCD